MFSHLCLFSACARPHPCNWESAWEEKLSWDFVFFKKKKKNVSFTFTLEDLAGVEFEAGNDFSSVLKA